MSDSKRPKKGSKEEVKKSGGSIELKADVLISVLESFDHYLVYATGTFNALLYYNVFGPQYFTQYKSRVNPMRAIDLNALQQSSDKQALAFIPLLKADVPIASIFVPSDQPKFACLAVSQQKPGENKLMPLQCFVWENPSWKIGESIAEPKPISTSLMFDPNRRYKLFAPDDQHLLLASVDPKHGEGHAIIVINLSPDGFYPPTPGSGYYSPEEDRYKEFPQSAKLKTKRFFTPNFHNVIDAAFFGENSIALVQSRAISIFDLGNLDDFDLKNRTRFEMPDVKRLFVWPGGHLWAVGKEAGNGTLSVSIWEYQKDAPLKKVADIPENIDETIEPKIIGGQFVYCPALGPRPLYDVCFVSQVIHAFNPADGLVREIFSDKLASHVSISSIFESQGRVGSISANGVKIHLLQTPDVRLKTETALDKLYESLPTFSRDVVGVVADYARMFPTQDYSLSRMPRPLEINSVIRSLSQCRERIHRLVEAKSFSPDQEAELTNAKNCIAGIEYLIQLLLTKPEKNYSTCIADAEKEFPILQAIENLAAKGEAKTATEIDQFTKLKNDLKKLLREIRTWDTPLAEIEPKRLR